MTSKASKQAKKPADVKAKAPEEKVEPKPAETTPVEAPALAQAEAPRKREGGKAKEAVTPNELMVTEHMTVMLENRSGRAIRVTEEAPASLGLSDLAVHDVPPHETLLVEKRDGVKYVPAFAD